MHKVTVALAAFAVFLGCDVGSPTSPSAAKSTETAAEQCPLPILGIEGTWARSSSAGVYCPNCEPDWEDVGTADTLRIALAPDPNPAGEPGVTYYDYTRLVYYSPSAEDNPALADLELPSLLGEVHGTMGVYYAGDRKWAYHETAHARAWDGKKKEYVDIGSSSPRWGLEIKMFDGWLVLDWGLEFQRVVE